MEKQKSIKMAEIIGEQVVSLMEKGVDYKIATKIVFDDINEKWPLAMADYIKSNES
jgi:hypothetical protein